MTTLLKLNVNKDATIHGTFSARSVLDVKAPGDGAASKFNVDVTSDDGKLLSNCLSQFTSTLQVGTNLASNQMLKVDTATNQISARATTLTLYNDVDPIGTEYKECLVVSSTGVKLGFQGADNTLPSITPNPLTLTGGLFTATTMDDDSRGIVGQADLTVSGTTLFSCPNTSNEVPAVIIKGQLDSNGVLATNMIVRKTLEVDTKARIHGTGDGYGLLAKQIRVDNGSGSGDNGDKWYGQMDATGIRVRRKTNDTLTGGELLTVSRGAEKVSMFGDVMTIEQDGITLTQDLTMTGASIHCKDIVVDGTMTTKHQEQMHIGDNHVYLNAHGVGTTSEDSGIVSACKKMYENDTLAEVSVSTDGVTTVTVTGTLPPWMDGNTGGAIIQITSDDHTEDPINGLYQIAPFTTNTIVLKTADTLGFVQTVFSGDSKLDSQSVKINQVEVSHLYFYEGDGNSTTGSHGTIKYGHGNNQNMIYKDLMAGDIKHSYESYTNLLEGEGSNPAQPANKHTFINAHVTNINLPSTPPSGQYTSDTSSTTMANAIFLMNSPDNGDNFKVINSSSDVDVWVYASMGAEIVNGDHVQWHNLPGTMRWRALVRAGACMTFTFSGDKYHII